MKRNVRFCVVLVFRKKSIKKQQNSKPFNKRNNKLEERKATQEIYFKCQMIFSPSFFMYIKFMNSERILFIRLLTSNLLYKWMNQINQEKQQKNCKKNK